MIEVYELLKIIAGILTASVTIGGFALCIVKWIFKQNQQDKDIKQLKEENTLICYALSACLDGLEQLGANHTVPKAKDKLEKYLNVQAHK